MHIQKKSMTLEEYQIKTGVFDKITKDLPAEEVEQMVNSKIIIVLEKHRFFSTFVWCRPPKHPNGRKSCPVEPRKPSISSQIFNGDKG